MRCLRGCSLCRSGCVRSLPDLDRKHRRRSRRRGRVPARAGLRAWSRRLYRQELRRRTRLCATPVGATRDREDLGSVMAASLSLWANVVEMDAWELPLSECGVSAPSTKSAATRAATGAGAPETAMTATTRTLPPTRRAQLPACPRCQPRRCRPGLAPERVRDTPTQARPEAAWLRVEVRRLWRSSMRQLSCQRRCPLFVCAASLFGGDIGWATMAMIRC